MVGDELDEEQQYTDRGRDAVTGAATEAALEEVVLPVQKASRNRSCPGVTCEKEKVTHPVTCQRESSSVSSGP